MNKEQQYKNSISNFIIKIFEVALHD